MMNRAIANQPPTRAAPLSKMLKFSRWRRLPSVSRVSDPKMSGPADDLQRLTLFLPGRLIDLAQELAQKAGAGTVQSYCESLLTQTLLAEQAKVKLADFESRRGALKGLDAIASDADYLVEWSSRMAHPRDEDLDSVPEDDIQPQPSRELQAVKPEEIVLRHAGRLGDDPAGFLATLGRGEPVQPDAARELLQALIDLEAELRDAPAIDRSLAFALHRIALVGQLLTTESWPGLGRDPATVQTLRMVHEAVDRVLSGEDIRYQSSGQDADTSTWDNTP